jgi:hypothetical protein|tara:strand:- start:3829 stop:4311 length:483 start_codon:yes stop_codon:yes gene_type:complete
MKIKIAFYAGEGNYINRIIKWWTKSPYSHAELIMPDNTWIGISPFKTSKIESVEKLVFEPCDWDIIDLEITSEQLSLIKEFFDSTRGCKYDWVGMILSQFLPYHIKRKGKWYCSEWIAYALRISNVVDWRLIKIYDRADLSPAVLHQIVTATKNGQVQSR